MATGPKEKPLGMLSFAAHLTRGVVRDQSTRRKTMFSILGMAILMLVAGTTFLQETLDHRAHPAWFIIFWLACGWLTATALLLALFDLLILRAQSRAIRKELGKELTPSATRFPKR